MAGHKEKCRPEMIIRPSDVKLDHGGRMHLKVDVHSMDVIYHCTPATTISSKSTGTMTHFLSLVRYP